MERKMNVDQVTRSERQEGFLTWRSFGAIAADIVAQEEARRKQGGPLDDAAFVPVVWAAE